MASSSSSTFVAVKMAASSSEMRNKMIQSSGDLAPAAAAAAAPAPPQKRKRNLPGTPSPDAEVIALSPETLMATNRFVCEVCNKGFQREQNLQLHRRKHNLPWRLKQKSSRDLMIRKKVYVCPVPGCVHHDPSRALGDLTGIKKHFLRKHGEKKFRCEKCDKSYAVQSDWKAHSKTCGTKEYRCECGTTFFRRDSYYSHLGNYCDALAQETARHSVIPTSIAATIYANASSASPMGMATAGPIISVDEPGYSPGFGFGFGFGFGGPGGAKTSFTSFLSGQSSVGSAYKPIQPLTIPNQTEHNFNFNVMFSGMMNAVADQGPVYAIPTPQLSATSLLQKASLMRSNSHGQVLMNSIGSSSSIGLKMNNYGGLGDRGIISGGFQELMFNSIAAGGGSNVYESTGGFAGEVENDYRLYSVKSAMDFEENRLERQVSVQSGYCDKLTRDFLGVENRRSFSGGAMEEQMEVNSPGCEATVAGLSEPAQEIQVGRAEGGLIFSIQ